MKRHRIIYIIGLISAIVCTPVLAENASFAEENSSYTDHYGIVDAIYIKESRLVISDINILYDHSSGFYGGNDSRIFKLKKRLKPGTPVKYHYYQKPPNLILKDLKIISKREFKKSQNLGIERY